MPSFRMNRRDFVAANLAAATAAATSYPKFSSVLTSRPETSLDGRIFKTLKIGMVRMKDKSLGEKFSAAKAAGFAGIEMNSPGMVVEETRKAIQESGLPVDGTVCSTHWQIRHSDPDANVRANALRDLEGAIRDTHAVGGNSVLLVIGHGKDGPEKEIWARSFENISKAVPLAARYGIHIVIENVWNHFLYDHKGDHTQTADKFVKYVDEFRSPWVGMQFDIGNHHKYGSMGDWIRTLGHRVIKLDLKGYHRENQSWAKISEGDIDWNDVRMALKEINYYGWAAAEVGGGDEKRLREISDNMDTVFALTK